MPSSASNLLFSAEDTLRRSNVTCTSQSKERKPRCEHHTVGASHCWGACTGGMKGRHFYLTPMGQAYMFGWYMVGQAYMGRGGRKVGVLKGESKRPKDLWGWRLTDKTPGQGRGCRERSPTPSPMPSPTLSLFLRLFPRLFLRLVTLNLSLGTTA
eukprot:126-Chlamydomonas_euryale.AAC.4